MKQILFGLFLFFSFTISWAGTPVMDGNFDGIGVWGNPRATADLVAGAIGANAKRLYITADANYIYLGAEVTVASYFRFAFLINTKTGGGTLDSWQQNISYDHTDKPDYVFRGDFGSIRPINGSNFGNNADFNTWDGSTWTNIFMPITNGATYFVADNIPNDFSLTDGFIETRIARSAIMTNTGTGQTLDVAQLEVQFLIVGFSQFQGSYDAVPDDNNAPDDSNLSAAISVSHYAPKLTVIGVTWLDFTAKVNKENTVNLDWSTASEKQNSHFDIERSANGRDWTTIGEVKGNGTRVSKSAYSFVDEAPLSVNYYRLKQVDFDDKFEYSSIVSVNMPISKKNFTVFPNPVTEQLNWTTNSLDTEGSIQIFDMKGSLVKTRQSAGNQLDVQDLSNGLYQIRFIDRHGTTLESARFVKK